MSRKNDRAKKNETAEKVKEIQMRQKNWFKEREKDLERKSSSPQMKDLTDSKTSKKFDGSVSAKTKSGAGKFEPQDKLGSSERTISAGTGKVQPKGKFKHWLEARESNKGKSDDVFDRDRDSVNILRVSSSRSPEFASPESDHFDDHRSGGPYREEPYKTYSERTGREAMNTLMSHQDFDALADSIVARVRQGINVDSRSGQETRQLWSKDVQSSSHAQSSEVDRGHKGHRDSKTRDRKGQREVNTSSHYCPCCHCLMLPPSNVPLINIPCGHSVCERCCKGTELCPSCDCHVTSKTCNLMLLQIIQGYHNETSRRTEVNRETKSYSPENYNEKHSYLKASSQSYREQYENLIARQDVLLGEADTIKGSMETLSDQIHRQQRQVHSIAQEETKLRKQMKELEEKLRQLTSHREEYSKEQDQLQQQYNTEANRLNLIKETLLTLEIEVEKVQLLAEGR